LDGVETTRYYYDGWRVIEERDGEDRLKAQYVYSGLDRPVEMRKGEKSYFFHQNSIGSVYFITGGWSKMIEVSLFEGERGSGRS
jgi:hypothetical protein